MKKYIKYIFINCLFILLILASGCSSRVKLPSETPEALVIIIGKHNNSQVFDLSLRDKIREVYSHFGNIAVIVADGNPTVLSEKGEIIGMYDNSYIEVSKEKYEYKTIWERDYLDNQTYVLMDALETCEPDNTEIDMLAALQTAQKILNQMENSMEQSVKKQIIVCDTGLSTAGSVNFQDSVCYKLLTSQSDISTDNEHKNELSEFLEQLDDSKEIPDLSDVSVTWYGIGNTASPQEELSALYKNNLQYIWGKILEASGCVKSDEGGTDNIFQIFVPIYGEGKYNYEYTVTPISIPQEEQQSENNPIPEKITEEEVGFKKESAELVSEEEAMQVLRPYVQYLADKPDMSILLVGTTADVNGGSLSLALDRANKIRDKMLELGVDENQLVTIGAGKDDPWHQNEWKNGQFIESIAAQNRAVYIVPEDSEWAKKILQSVENGQFIS